MERRRFLTVGAAAAALGVAGCIDQTNDANPETSARDGPGSQPATTDESTQSDESPTPGETTDAADGSASGQAWGSSGQQDGVTFSFSSQGPEPEDTQGSADIGFDTAAGEVVVDGTIDGSDACKRARLGTVTYDESAERLTVGVETTDVEQCEEGGAGAQVKVSIDYEGTFDVPGDGLPATVTVEHHGTEIASATAERGSAAATPPDTITST